MKKTSVTYAASGVDIAQSDRAKQRIRQLAKKTLDRNVLGGVGGFGGLFALDKRRWKSPVLVSSTDGVGTKLKVAFATGSHRSVAADLVNHCANDIAVQGATPLFFLDYFACGRLEPEVLEQVITGLSEACRAHRCALLGGETAEMPDFYREGEYDLAGFIVGVVERGRILDGSKIQAGDLVLGLPSAGLHTNGYSLARRLLLETGGYALEDELPRLGSSVADELLKPHRSYAAILDRLNRAGVLKGAAHITGGGIPGNVPRILPKGLEAHVEGRKLARAAGLSPVARDRQCSRRRDAPHLQPRDRHGAGCFAQEDGEGRDDLKTGQGDVLPHRLDRPGTARRCLQRGPPGYRRGAYGIIRAATVRERATRIRRFAHGQNNKCRSLVGALLGMTNMFGS